MEEKEKILIMTSEITHLESAIKDIAPKLSAATKLYNELRNKHAALVTEHRNKQRDMRLLQGKFKKLAPYQSAKKPLNRQPSKASIKATISALSKEDKAALRAQLMGE